MYHLMALGSPSLSPPRPETLARKSRFPCKRPANRVRPRHFRPGQASSIGFARRCNAA
ncbi:hypothetical protein BCR44DRAFT_1423920 [Catenaria anguillulae PL171]|uniref:Uncharacterized protein n=1 Tax=Catenaria anguillulae PL171 TaxID=765915 RepID=A0A1Y2I284_9FUNG|nr:hypothetical protein BCR44DRAFT_1423920 [Catenaria anguillulae PL171]